MANIKFNEEYRLQVVELVAGVWYPLSNKANADHFVDGFNERPFAGRTRSIEEGDLDGIIRKGFIATSSYNAHEIGNRLRQRFNRGEMGVREDGMLVVVK